MPHKRQPMSVRSAALWSIGSQYLVFAIQFAVSVLISRFFLLPAEVGLFSIGLAAALLVAILQDFGLTRYIAGQPEMTPEQLRVCSSVSAIFALALAGLIAALAWPMSLLYAEPRLVAIILVIAASYLFVPFSVVPLALATRAMDFRSVFLVNLAGAVAGGIVALGLAAAGFSAISLAWSTVAIAIARAIAAQWCHPAPIPFPLELTGSSGVVRFGSANSALFVSGAIGTRSPDLVVGGLLSLTAVGLFSRATGLAAQFRTLVSGAIGGVFYPAFARMRDEGRPLGPPYERVVAGYTAVIWPAMAMLALASQPVVLMLYGPDWAGVAPLLAWIAVAEMIFPALPLHVELPILLGRMRRLIRLNIIDTVLAIGLLALASQKGVEWAAASRILYGVGWMALYAPWIIRLAGTDAWRLGRLYLLSLAVTGLALTPMLALIISGRAMAELGAVELLAAGTIGGALWLAGLYLLRHPAASEITGLLGTAWAAVPRPRSAR